MYRLHTCLSLARTNRCYASARRLRYSVRYVGIRSFDGEFVRISFVSMSPGSLVGDSHRSTSLRQDERTRHYERDHHVGTCGTDECIARVAATYHPAVRQCECSSNSCREHVVSRLKIKQADRPSTYDEIQASPAMKSLPSEITNEETVMVRNVIANIPLAPDDF